MTKYRVTMVIGLVFMFGLTLISYLNLSVERKVNADIYAIYQLAVNSDVGYEGTYDEWLEIIKGDQLELRFNDELGIEWKYDYQTEWTILVSNDEIRGRSAYDLWKASSSANANKTEAEFLASMKGDTGLSAYQLWQALSTANQDKTITDFINSLKGDSAITLWLIINPTKTEDDFWTSIVGEPGASAYELWLEKYGYTEADKTIDDYFDYLRGDTGDGGLSAFDIWVSLDENKDKTEEDFLSLIEHHPGYDIYASFFGGNPPLSEEEWLAELYTVYTVTFITNNDQTIEEQYILNGKKIKEPDALTKENYLFDGWYIGNEEWSFIGYSVTSDIQLVAKWKSPMLYISDFAWDDNNLEYRLDVSSQTSYINVSKYIDTNMNYTIYGDDYVTEISNLIDLSYSTNKIKIVFEDGQEYFFNIYRKHLVTITFKTNCDMLVQQQVINIGEYLGSVSTLIKTGYDFDGWYDGTTKVDLSSHKFDDDTLLEAKWIAKEYTITFNTTISNDSITPLIVTYHEYVTLPIPTSLTSGFLYWSLNGEEVSDGVWNIASDITLVAEWTNVVKISYNFNDDDDTVQNEDGSPLSYFEVYSYDMNDWISLVVLTKKGCTFDGWYDNPEFNGSSLCSIYIGDELYYNLYAKWSINDYTISIEPIYEGLIIDQSEIDYVTNSSYITLPYNTSLNIEEPFVPTGYTFEGWYLDDTFKIPFEDKTMDCEDKLIYGYFKPVVYEIYLIKDGVMETAYWSLGDGDSILDIEDKPGYEFNGWYYDAVTSMKKIETINLETLYSLGYIVPSNATADPKALIAVYDLIKYTIKYDLTSLSGTGSYYNEYITGLPDDTLSVETIYFEFPIPTLNTSSVGNLSIYFYGWRLVHEEKVPKISETDLLVEYFNENRVLTLYAITRYVSN